MADGHRLTFLVVESEPAQGLSTRKLLLETAKHNVLTAYSPDEGVMMLNRFPRIDVAAVDGSFGDLVCTNMVKQLRDTRPDIQVVAFLPHVGARCTWADKTTDSHDPAQLLKVMEELGASTDIA